MGQDRDKWNEKYRQHAYPTEPSAIVTQFCSLAPDRAALDIGAGNGRNALFLAEQGFVVDAVDISDVGLSLFAGRHPNVHCLCADLDTFEIPRHRYGLITNIKYLNRRLFPQIREGLAAGGVLIFETFLETSDERVHQPSCSDHVLRKNELLHEFLSLQIIFYQEALNTHGQEPGYLASLVAVKP
jgi:tellurite methyltransferase